MEWKILPQQSFCLNISLQTELEHIAHNQKRNPSIPVHLQQYT